jgi:hypothetical protein
MRLLSLVLASGLGLGCGGKKPDPVGPVAGNLTVSYTGPSQTDGALLIVVNGAVSSVTPVSGYHIASAPLGPTSTRVVISGPLVAGDLFRVSVTDVNAVAGYTAFVEAAADRNTFALNDPAGYSASLRK